MEHARGARALREAAALPEPDARVAAVAAQLGLADDAAQLLAGCGRWDLLARLRQAGGEWERAVEVADANDRQAGVGGIIFWVGGGCSSGPGGNLRLAAKAAAAAQDMPGRRGALAYTSARLRARLLFQRHRAKCTHPPTNQAPPARGAFRVCPPPGALRGRARRGAALRGGGVGGGRGAADDDGEGAGGGAGKVGGRLGTQRPRGGGERKRGGPGWRGAANGSGRWAGAPRPPQVVARTGQCDRACADRLSRAPACLAPRGALITPAPLTAAPQLRPAARRAPPAGVVGALLRVAGRFCQGAQLLPTDGWAAGSWGHI
jgi:hypothetical protein